MLVMCVCVLNNTGKVWPALDALTYTEAKAGLTTRATPPHLVVLCQAELGTVQLIHLAIYSEPYLAVSGLESSVSRVLVTKLSSTKLF